MRVRGYHLFNENRFGTGNVFDGLARNGIRQKPDEVARMASLEAAYARTVSRTRIDNNERPQLRVDLNAIRRDDTRKRIVHGPVKLASVRDELDFVVENMRSGLGHVLEVLIPALPHYVPKQ